MKRCMIVDASDVIRRVARRILESQDMVVVEAANGREALAHCDQKVPDIILVEARLPDMAMSDFLHNVQLNNAKPQIVISLIRLDIGAIMRAKRAGASGYLLKPFDRSHLLGSLRQSFGSTGNKRPTMTAA
ncbi:response regulator [Tianweitania sp. BSSL-BM11]|uniref:Response regulator n=1 Tax=Tianweitania aestuarii TaxID=2814886 RepID=A0ABS5RVN7_9HYPH|nr:response regulator [Tianweitania aestuarii]MBS9721128.1 response regulator [Tianweitania aestuarii]